MSSSDEGGRGDVLLDRLVVTVSDVPFELVIG